MYVCAYLVVHTYMSKPVIQQVDLGSKMKQIGCSNFEASFLNCFVTNENMTDHKIDVRNAA